MDVPCPRFCNGGGIGGSVTKEVGKADKGVTTSRIQLDARLGRIGQGRVCSVSNRIVFTEKQIKSCSNFFKAFVQNMVLENRGTRPQS